MAKKDKKQKAAGPVKMTAPKQVKPTEHKEEEVVLMPVKKTKNVKQTKSTTEKVDKKAEAKAAKVEKKATKKRKHDEKALHFHFFRALFGLLIFVLASIVMIAGAFLLYNDGIENEVITFHTTPTSEFVIGIIIMFAFMIWMSEFQVGWRRFFRIGRHERVRKAEEHKAKKIAKLEKKHADKNK